MTDPTLILAAAGSSLAGIGILAAATLKGWRGWLDLQRLALERQGGPNEGVPQAGARIEIADLKERIRKLEAIAAGVDL
ncbi:hypothetical protein [Sphingomonas sp. ID0503]|uniref:hypothetical protein n=1 Tax=Sphingomonas sp. ID0503 TaxID=3399691 RepID=UPI003AFA2596